MPDPVERPYDCSEASVQPQDEDVGTCDCSDLPTKSIQNKAFTHDTELNHNIAQQALKLTCKNDLTIATDKNVEINSPSAACGAVLFMPESAGSSTEVFGPTAESDIQEREENSNRPHDENRQIAGDVSSTLSNRKQIRGGIGSAVCRGRDSEFVNLSIERPNDNNPRQNYPEKIDIGMLRGHIMATEVGTTCVAKQVSCDENSCENPLIGSKNAGHLLTVTRNNVDVKVFFLPVQKPASSDRIHSQEEENQFQTHAWTAMLNHDGRHEGILQLEAQDNILQLKAIPRQCTHSLKQAKVTLSVADSGLVPSDCRNALVRNKSTAIQGERKNTELQATYNLIPIGSEFHSVMQVEKDGRGIQANSILEDNQGKKSGKNDLDFRETTLCVGSKNSPALQEEFNARGSPRTYHNYRLGIVMLTQMGIGEKLSKSRGHFVKARWMVVCPPMNKRALLKLPTPSLQNDSTLKTTNLADTVSGKESNVWPCEREYSEIVAVMVNSLWTKETQRKCDIEVHYAMFLPGRDYCHADKNESLHQDVWEKFTVVLLRFDLCEMTFEIDRIIQYCQVVIVLLSNRMPPAEMVKENQMLERTELFNTQPGVSRFLNGFCALRDRLYFALSHEIDGKYQGMNENMFLMPKGKQVCIVFFSKNTGRGSQMRKVSVAHGTFQVTPRPLENAYITTSTFYFATGKILDRLQENHRKETSKCSTLNGDLKENKCYSNAILSKDKPTRECMLNFIAIHVHGLYVIILQETRSVNPNWLFEPSTFQWELCYCEADIYVTEARKLMVIKTSATALEGIPCVEETGNIFDFLKAGQRAFRNIHEKNDQCRELFMCIVQCGKPCRVGYRIASVEKKFSKKVEFMNDKMSASFVVHRVMDLVKNRASDSFENDELGLRSLLFQTLKTKVLWCMSQKKLQSATLIVLNLERETIIDAVSDTIYLQTCIPSNQTTEKDASSIPNLEKTGEVKKNLSAIDSPNVSSAEGTQRKTLFHFLKSSKGIIAILDEEASITGHGHSNGMIQPRNTLLIQTVGTSLLTFGPEIHEIGSEHPNPGQSLMQTLLPNVGKREDEEDSVGKQIFQVNVSSARSECASAGNDHSDILYAAEKIEMNRDHSTSVVVHESKSLFSALKQEEQVTAENTGKDTSNTSNLEKRGEMKKNVSSAIDSPNVSSTEDTERKSLFDGLKRYKKIAATLDEEDNITGHGDSNEIIQLEDKSLIQTVETSSLTFKTENRQIGSDHPNPGHSLVQKSLLIFDKTPETKESVEKITPDLSYTEPVGFNSKDAAVANENLANAKLSEENSVGLNNLLSKKRDEIALQPTDQKPSYCVPVCEKQITEQSTPGPAEQGLDENIFEPSQIDGIHCNDKPGKDLPMPDQQLLNGNSLSNSKLIRDELDEIAAEKLMMDHMRLSKLCQELDEFHSIHTSDFDMITEPQVYEKTNWSPPLDVGMQDGHNRRISFNGRRNTRFNADDFSQGGFYLSYDNVVECYSCRARHSIDDVTSAPGTYRYHQRGCQHLHNIRSRRNEPDVVETDGRVSDDIADPPGQQSLYIPPGDVRREAYRLSTFEHFPVTCPISRKSLAKSGFFFTGFYDRVKCFACARTVERWEETDNPAQLKWHKPTCPFPKGQECGNVSLPNLFQAIAPVPAAGSPSSAAQSTNQPTNQGERILEQRDPNSGAIIRRVRYPADLPERIRQTGGTFEIGPNNEVIIRSGPGPGERNPENVGLQATATQQQPRRQWRMANVISADHKRFLTNLYLNRELDRLASFARWPTGRPNIAPAYLAKTGFFYLGDMDRTQCFSCGGVLRNWNLQDDAEAEHRTHFPQCRMVLNLEPRNIPVHENPETEEEKERKYPLRFPANPHMRSENARLGTFDRRWPMGKTAATPAEIAQGGFFFLGDRDRAKCWYCNGGLQNWEYDDIPWIEHAKWFPNCQFLLRVKGQHFVYRHLALHPHLARPIIARQDGSPLESVGGQPAATSGGQARAQRSQDIPPSEPRVNQPSATPVIIDPRADARKRKERVQNIMRNSDLVKNVLAMGFDDKIVASLLEDRIISGNEANVEDVYESASQLLDDVFKKEEEIRNQASTAVLTPTPSLSGAASTGTTTSMYSGVSGATDMSSLGPAPGSGKYNVSYFGDDDDEDMEQDMYGSMEGTSASVTNVTAAKRLLDAEENRESLQDALNKIEEERMCKICFTNQADMVFQPCAHMCCCMECTQAITQCPVCRKKIEKAIKTYVN